MNKYTIISLVCIALVFEYCAPDQKVDDRDKIIALGHIYRYGPDIGKIDLRLEEVEFDGFKEVWLLGDVCAATDSSESILQYLDQIFNLNKMDTKWAIGNHDIYSGHIENIKRYSGRDFYYGNVYDHYATYVLNTQAHYPPFKDSCSFFEAQHNDFKQFLATININKPAELKSLFVLSHNPVWSDAEPELRAYDLIGNAAAGWIDLICEWNGEFRNQYLQDLVKIQNSGIQVYCIAGDGGQYSKTFSVKGSSGIQYYVSGINNSVLDYIGNSDNSKFDTRPDSVLILTFDNDSKTFTEEFIPVDKI